MQILLLENVYIVSKKYNRTRVDEFIVYSENDTKNNILRKIFWNDKFQFYEKYSGVTNFKFLLLSILLITDH